MALDERVLRGEATIDLRDRPVTLRARLGRTASRAWARPLWAHLSVLVVAALLLWPAMLPRTAFQSDEGVYALQVRALERGSWTYPYWASPIDRNWRFDPLFSAPMGNRSGHAPYTKHPLYALALWAGVGLTGGSIFGFYLLSLAGLAAAAAAAWLLAGEIDPRARRAAFWLVAASPVAVSGFVIWAHAPSVALSGFALVGAIRIWRDGPSARAVLLVAGSLVLNVLLRTEAALFAAALVAVLGVAGLRRWGAARAGLVGAACALPVAAAIAGERVWAAAITGGPINTTLPDSTYGAATYLGGRTQGAWRVLFTSGGLGRENALLTAALLVSVAVAALALRRNRRNVFVAAAASASMLYAIRFGLKPSIPIAGLVLAWPVAFVALALLRRRDVTRTHAFLLATVLLFALGVLATQYARGGSLEFGGRYLSPVIVPLAVVAATVLVRHPITSLRGFARWPLVALVAVPVMVGIGSVPAMRLNFDRLGNAVLATGAPVAVTNVDELPYDLWRVDGRVRWLRASARDLPAALRALRSSGYARVAVVGSFWGRPAGAFAPYDRVTEIDNGAVSSDGYRVVVLQ